MTTIRQFIEDIKQIYPDFCFKFEEYNEDSSVLEKFEFFKKINTALKARYGKGYLKEKETAVDNCFCQAEDIDDIETAIIYSLYNSEDNDAIYRAAVITVCYEMEVPSFVINSIIDELFEHKKSNENHKDWGLVEDLLKGDFVFEIPIESLVHYLYKEPKMINLRPEGVEVSDIFNIENCKAECKALLRKSADIYAGLCLSIFGLWTEEELIKFSESKSEYLRWNIALNGDVPPEIMIKLQHDKSKQVASLAKEWCEINI